ncbi:MAG: hypothetical protein HOG49_25210 [Candidatus Scalindua sp.]|jgi:hypothetical protein|nr:hypothetical protein [Candidatus Scalindua sp.]
MKVKKHASGKTTVKLSQKEWEKIGKEAGWDKESQVQVQPQIDPSQLYGEVAALIKGKGLQVIGNASSALSGAITQIVNENATRSPQTEEAYGDMTSPRG